MLLALLVASTAARTNWAAWSFITAVNSFAFMRCVELFRHVCRLSQKWVVEATTRVQLSSRSKI